MGKFFENKTFELFLTWNPVASTLIKDAYTLKFFKNNSSCLPKWCNNDGDPVKLPFCQIKGKYQMELPEYNTMELYSHMNERCPSLPPKYYRPEGHYMIEVSVMTAILVSAVSTWNIGKLQTGTVELPAT
ncbi:hypothetical protein CsSME_00026199 [Camellia sinensis var. sinensis]